MFGFAAVDHDPEEVAVLGQLHDEAQIVLVDEGLLVLDDIGMDYPGEQADLVEAIVLFRGG